MKKKILISSLGFLIALASCSSQKKEYVYKFNLSKKISSSELRESGNKIDSGTTYEIFFTLEKDVSCINASVTSATLQDKFSGKSKPIRTFFIIERAIDISGYSGQKSGTEYSEIERNYDSSWDRKQNITICSSETDPLKKINSTSVYRIRFSNYIPEETNFSILISADTNVSIFTEFPKKQN